MAHGSIGAVAAAIAASRIVPPPATPRRAAPRRPAALPDPAAATATDGEVVGRWDLAITYAHAPTLRAGGELAAGDQAIGSPDYGLSHLWPERRGEVWSFDPRDLDAVEDAIIDLFLAHAEGPQRALPTRQVLSLAYRGNDGRTWHVRYEGRYRTAAGTPQLVVRRIGAETH